MERVGSWDYRESINMMHAWFGISTQGNVIQHVKPNGQANCSQRWWCIDLSEIEVVGALLASTSGLQQYTQVFPSDLVHVASTAETTTAGLPKEQV
jgi:hypothetical protein